jgi:hypothetical protein
MNLELIKKWDILKKYALSQSEMEDELESFIDYWTEPNKKWKERWEFEKTFEPNRRFLRWLRNNKKWGKKRGDSKTITI